MKIDIRGAALCSWLLVVGTPGLVAQGGQPLQSAIASVGIPWVCEARLQSGDWRLDNFLGASVAISGETVVLAAPAEQAGPTDALRLPTFGVVHVFVRNESGWIEEARLRADEPNGAARRFGASIAISGQTLVVGAESNLPGESGLLGMVPGTVYVFERHNGMWTQRAVLESENQDGRDRFGASVSIAGDFIIVGSPGETVIGTSVDRDVAAPVAEAGAAHVFVRQGSQWTRQAHLKSPWPRAGDHFGFSVAASEDTIVIGAENEDGDVPDAGAIHVFGRKGIQWTPEAHLRVDPAGGADRLGHSVAIWGDTIVAGAYGQGSHGGVPNAGAAFVFVRGRGGWSQQAILTAANADPNDVFGWSVAITGDTALIGAIREDSLARGPKPDPASNASVDSGAAYLFEREGARWSQKAYLKAFDSPEKSYFGYSVAGANGTWVIGAPAERTQSSVNPTHGVDPARIAGLAGAAYVVVPETQSRVQAMAAALQTGLFQVLPSKTDGVPPETILTARGGQAGNSILVGQMNSDSTAASPSLIGSTGSFLELIGQTGEPAHLILDSTTSSGGKRWRLGETSNPAFGPFSIRNETDGVLALQINPNGQVTASGKVTIDLGGGRGPKGVIRGSHLAMYGVDGASVSSVMVSYGSNNGNNYAHYNIGGTRAAPAATPDNHGIFTLGALGHNGTELTGTQASFGCNSDGSWGPDNAGTYFLFNGTARGSTVREEWARLASGAFLIGASTRVGGERLRVTGGANTEMPGPTDVLIGGGHLKIGGDLLVNGRITALGGIAGIPGASPTNGLTVTGRELNVAIHSLGTGGALVLSNTSPGGTSWGVGEILNNGTLDFRNSAAGSPSVLRLSATTPGTPDANQVLIGNGEIRAGRTIDSAGKVTIDVGTGPTGIAVGSHLAMFGADGAASTTVMAAYGANAGNNQVFYNIGGTRSAPSGPLNQQAFFYLTARGHDGRALTRNQGLFGCIADGDWTEASLGTYFHFYGTPPGSTSPSEWARLTRGALLVGSSSLIGTERMRITGGAITGTPSTHDVLIGGGHMTTGGDVIALGRLSTRSGIELHTESVTWNQYIDASGRLRLESNAGGSFVVQDDGKVGIGTVTPSSALSVNGTITAKEIRVTSTGADYVFAEDYPLMPLAEVEAFVAQEKHLPGIAPARDMQKNGLPVSEVVTRQLAKIEELTLYAIDLQKQNDSLRRELRREVAEARLREAEIIRRMDALERR